jgi:hypothetical protein
MEGIWNVVGRFFIAMPMCALTSAIICRNASADDGDQPTRIARLTDLSATTFEFGWPLTFIESKPILRPTLEIDFEHDEWVTISGMNFIADSICLGTLLHCTPLVAKVRYGLIIAGQP